MQSRQCLVEKVCLSWTDGKTLFNAVQEIFCLLCYEKGFLLSTRTLKFSVGLKSAFQTLGTQRILVSGVTQPRKRTLIFILLHKIPLSPFLQLKPLWMAKQSSISCSSQFCNICENLLRVCSVSASRSLMKVLKYSPWYQPLGYTTSYLPPPGLYDSDEN